MQTPSHYINQSTKQKLSCIAIAKAKKETLIKNSFAESSLVGGLQMNLCEEATKAKQK
jgi:hypothetical protein